MRTFQSEFITGSVIEFYAAKILFMASSPGTIYGKRYFVGYRTVMGRQVHLFRYPLEGLQKLVALPYKERVKLFNTGEEQEFLPLFDNAMDGPDTAYQCLLSGESYWCECADCYLVAGFGLTPEAACESLQQFFLARA